jgi:hypothetical protein
MHELAMQKPAVRYWDGKDQLAEKMLNILSQESTPVGTFLCGSSYDRLTDVAVQAGMTEGTILLNVADSPSATLAIARLEFSSNSVNRPDRRFGDSNPIVRLVSRIESLSTKRIVIENGEGFQKCDLVVLTQSLATLKPESRPKLLLTVTGSFESYDAILNNGKLPWGIHCAPSLAYKDMIEFLKMENVRINEGLLKDPSGMVLLATVCRQAPQGLKRLADVLKGKKVTELKLRDLCEMAPLLDSRSTLPKQLGQFANLPGIRIPSSRTRSRTKIPRGQLPLPQQLPLF